MALLLFDQDNLQGFGLFVIGVCPGGMSSNSFTVLLDGDVNLSVTMTFLSTIVAMGISSDKNKNLIKMHYAINIIF